jgi:hypothetical protein
MQHNKIHKLAVELSQNKPGLPSYLCSYNTVCKQVERKLMENQCQSYKAMAKEWLETKLPPRMQQWYVHCK